MLQSRPGVPGIPVLCTDTFGQAGGAVDADPRALLEFAQTKLQLAREAHVQCNRDMNRRILTEARARLEQVIHSDASPARHALSVERVGADIAIA